jgi:hypothetical protein
MWFLGAAKGGTDTVFQPLAQHDRAAGHGLRANVVPMLGNAHTVTAIL